MPNPTFPVQFEGESYDIKKFLRDHPGGLETLKKYKGKSIFQAMTKFGHSTNAYHLLKDFKVEKGVDTDVNLTGSVSGKGRIITNEEEGRKIEEVKFLEELEGRLDWSQPILSQIEKIAPHYNLWVNTAVYKELRLFSSPVLESMTFTPWYLVPVFWVPVLLWMGWTQWLEYVSCQECSESPLSSLQYLTHIISGIILWTLLEYTLHRWVFHLNPGSSITMMRIHFLIHGLHHKVPFDSLRQVFPPLPAAVLAALFYVPLQMLVTYPRIKLTGGLLGYLFYDMIHCYLHSGSPKDGSYLYAMKRYHSNHHFINHDKAFGISSKIWDLVFRTFVQVRRLGFSLHW